MLFYTDGLIENPRRHGDRARWGEHGLLAWLDARPPVAPLSDTADELMRAATDGRDVHDDVAVLMIAAGR